MGEHFATEQQLQEDQYFAPYHYFIERGSLSGNAYFSYIDKCIEIVCLFKHKRILDAGCGDGFFVSKLDCRNNEIFGIDYSEKAISFARVFNEDRGIRFVCSAIEGIPFQDEFFDVVTNIAVLEHIRPENVELCLKEMSRVIKKDGFLILVVPTHNLKKTKKHFQHFSLEEIIRATASLFEVSEVCGVYNCIFPKILRFFDNRFIDIKPISKWLKEFLFYRYFANCSIRAAGLLVLTLRKR